MIKIILFLIVLSKIVYAEIDFDTNAEIYLMGEKFENISTNTETEARVLTEKNIDDFNIQMEYVIKDKEQYFDVIKLKIIKKYIELEVGKNRIGWGVGQNINPSDVFNSIPTGAYYDPYFRKQGRESLIISKYFTDAMCQYVYAVKNDDLESEYGIKYKKNIYNTDIEVLYINKGENKILSQKKDNLYATNIKGTLPFWDIGIWGEYVLYQKQDIKDYVVGLERYFPKNFYTSIEYYKNGFGEKKKENYNYIYMENEKYMGEDYAILSITWEMNEKWNPNFILNKNINDKSTTSVVNIIYYFNDYIEGNLMFVGMEGESDSEYGLYKDIYGKYGISAKIKIVI